MQPGDSKKNLLALRKTYARLEKIFLHPESAGAETASGQSVPAKSAKRELLKEIMLREGARRIFETGSGKCSVEAAKLDLKKQLKTALLPEIYQVLPLEEKSIFSPLLLCSLADELARQKELFDLFDERIFGYFYQFSCQGARDEALCRIQSADKKSSTRDIISFTQLYTPDWVADYLLSSTVLSQWQDSKTDKYGFYLAAARNNGAPDGTLPAGAIKILDPACGAGHILLRAFDLLLDMHLQEGKTAEESIRPILCGNLHGCDLDRTALFVCGLSLVVKALCRSNICFDFKLHIDAALNNTPFTAGREYESGSLCRTWPDNHILSSRYQAVITNPPYIGRRLLDRRLKQFLKLEYGTAHHDLSAAFLVRALELVQDDGKVGFITQSSLLYLPSYGELRRKFIESRLVESVIELGTHVFPLTAGEKINSMLIVLSRQGLPPERKSKFIDLTKSKTKSADLKNICRASLCVDAPAGTVSRNAADFLACRQFAFNYRCPQFLGKIMQNCRKLSEFAQIKQGLATSDNKRFVRYWWDVDETELGMRFHPYIKGAGGQRWQAACPTVLDWGSDGRSIKDAVGSNYPYLKGHIGWVVKNEQFYFRPGLTFSFVSTGNFSVRRLPAGAIFDVGGSALFCENEMEPVLLAYLNSSFAAECAQLINPTFNFQVGDIKEIPVPDFLPADKMRLKDLALEACSIKSWLVGFDETNFAYGTPAPLKAVLAGNDPESHWQALSKEQQLKLSKLSQIECEIDFIILQSLQLTFSLTKDELAHLGFLLSERQKKHKAATAAFAGPADFAASLLRAFLRELAGKQPCIQTDARQPFRQIMSCPLHLFLEKQLGMPLSRYFPDIFNREQEKIFSGCPQMFAVSGPAAGELICISSRGFHNLTKAPGAKSYFNECRSLITEQIAEKLSCLENWTGKDFSLIARTLSVNSVQKPGCSKNTG